MENQNRLSNVTKDYLTAFRCILDEMMRGMTGAELTDSISHNFIVQMIPHHRAAIEMSRNILKYTTNLEVQEIATRIVSEQTQSIAEMREAACACGREKNAQQQLCRYQERMEQIMQAMFCRMERAQATNQIDADFMRQMIPHHRGAVEMAENALCYPICPELEPILRAIIASQERGICQMRQLLARMGCCAR